VEAGGQTRLFAFREWPWNLHRAKRKFFIKPVILKIMHFKTLLIDLDETVYSPSCGVWNAISVRMERYMHEQLHLPVEEIPAIRKDLYQRYGTTLHGLQETRQIDARAYNNYVHDIAVDQYLQPDPELREILLRYPQRRIIFTNADRTHAERVIRCLGIQDCFENIIDSYDISPFCKPMTEAFQTALKIIDCQNPAECVFIDDSPRNLAGAREVGLYTIQVGQPKPGYQHPASTAHARIDRLHDLPRVIPPQENF
jgi:putative hydrolase of the HAD superfamily